MYPVNSHSCTMQLVKCYPWLARTPFRHLRASCSSPEIIFKLLTGWLKSNRSLSTHWTIRHKGSFIRPPEQTSVHQIYRLHSTSEWRRTCTHFFGAYFFLTSNTPHAVTPAVSPAIWLCNERSKMRLKNKLQTLLTSDTYSHKLKSCAGAFDVKSYRN